MDKLEILTDLSRGHYKAFLYDCDGTLADSMQAHKESYVQVAARHDVSIDPSIIDEFAGLPTALVVEEINKRYGANFDPLAFEEAKHEVFFTKYIENVKPIDFVKDHLIVHSDKVKIGVVSGSSGATVRKTLEVLGLSKYVEVCVCAGDTERGKPYPDPFLLAAEKLGVAAADCLVFEDGEPGVRAAEAAGMDWIRIDKIGH